MAGKCADQLALQSAPSVLGRRGDASSHGSGDLRRVAEAARRSEMAIHGINAALGPVARLHARRGPRQGVDAKTGKISRGDGGFVAALSYNQAMEYVEQRNGGYYVKGVRVS